MTNQKARAWHRNFQFKHEIAIKMRPCTIEHTNSMRDKKSVNTITHHHESSISQNSIQLTKLNRRWNDISRLTFSNLYSHYVSLYFMNQCYCCCCERTNRMHSAHTDHPIEFQFFFNFPLQSWHQLWKQWNIDEHKPKAGKLKYLKKKRNGKNVNKIRKITWNFVGNYLIERTTMFKWNFVWKPKTPNKIKFSKRTRLFSLFTHVLRPDSHRK